MEMVWPDLHNVEQHLHQLGELAQKCPPALQPVIQALIAEIDLTRPGVADGRARARQVPSPCGTWTVARFVSFGLPWVGLRWPTEGDQRTIMWLIKRLRVREMLTKRDGVQAGEVWIFLNRQ